MRRLLVLLAVAAAGAGAYVALADRSPAVAGEWERLPDPPLSARDGALGEWTGREVIVFGGVDAPSCPNCSSETAPRALRDGAAYDPATRRWRRIADLPVGLDFANTAVASGHVFALTERALLAYSLEQDRWRRAPEPPGAGEYGVTSAGDRLIAFGDGRVSAYDPRARRWSPLPSVTADVVLWTGADLVALTCEDEPRAEACLVTGAVLDGDRWEPLPDSRINSLPGSWVAVEGRVLCPCLGDSNSQRQFVREPAYPNGGILDVERGRWSPLPDPPDTGDIWGGVLTAGAAASLGPGRLVLDLDRGEWMRIPEHPYESVHGATTVTAGRSLFTFGGTRNLALLGARAWMWTPPRR